MSKATEPRPHLIDRARSAWRTFKDPNGTFLSNYLDGVRDFPRIVEGVITRRDEPQPASPAPFYVSPFSLSAWPPDTSTPVFDYTPFCPPGFGCAGHVDDSALTSHHTHWERFGPSGVVVTQDDDGPALVSPGDVREGPLTAEHALLLCREIEMAAMFAMRCNHARLFGQVTA